MMRTTTSRPALLTGALALALGGVLAAPAAQASSGPAATGTAPLSFEHVGSFGESGNGPGKFLTPRGLDVVDGWTFVTDSLAHEIDAFGGGGPYAWTEGGDPVGTFQAPYDIAAVSPTKFFFVDSAHHRVVRVSSGDASAWGNLGSGNKQFNAPGALDVAPDGNVVVLDTFNQRVQEFTETGTFVRAFGGKGDGPGQFDEAFGLGIGADGTIYTADRDLARVTKFSADGGYLAHWTGSGAGKLQSPAGLDVGPDGSVYVVDAGSSSVKVFSPSGAFRAEIGAGKLQSPWGVAVTPDGQVHVTDMASDTVETFRPVLKALSAPKVSGTKKVGKTLKATAGTWPVPGVSLKYQWLRDGKAIGGATGSSYKLKVKDAGARLSVRVTASSPGYPSAAATSSSVKVAKLKAKVSVKLAKKSIKAKQRGKVTVTVKISGIKKPTGKLLIRDGKKTIKTVTLKAKHQGKVTVKLPKLKKGKHKISAQLKATKQLAKSTSSKKNLRVR